MQAHSSRPPHGSALGQNATQGYSDLLALLYEHREGSSGAREAHLEDEPVLTTHHRAHKHTVQLLVILF